MDLIDILLSASFWAAAIRIASPLIFATIGELICERAGVLNLGIEGIMVFAVDNAVCKVSAAVASFVLQSSKSVW